MPARMDECCATFLGSWIPLPLVEDPSFYPSLGASKGVDFLWWAVSFMNYVGPDTGESEA